MKFIDTHAHLDFDFDIDTNSIIQKANTQGVDKIINVSSSPDNFDKIIEISTEHKFVYNTLGVHPHEAKMYNSDIETKIHKLNNSKTLAIGEIGLDYYYEFSDKQIQKAVFLKQIEIAYNLKLPIILHIRDAHDDAFDIINNEINNIYGAVVHCYSSSKEYLKKYLDLGLFVSFTGIISFKKAEIVKDALKYTPLDRLMIETDAPYLAPNPHRGKTNYPEYIPIIAKNVSEIKNIELSTLAPILYTNSIKFFNIK